MREIGIVRLVQIQQSSLKAGEKPQQRYDPTPLLVVDEVEIAPEGVVGLTVDGGRFIDVHNERHPESKNNRYNAISVGFTSHYTFIQERFGDHLPVGIAGENIIVDSGTQYTLADLGQKLVFKNPSTGMMTTLQNLRVAAPCEPFSRFVLDQADVPPQQMKATLQALHDGIRGFYATAADIGTISAGDQVFVVD